MIKLEVEEYCHDCGLFEPEAVKLNYLDTKEGKLKPIIKVFCERRTECEAIKLYLEQRLTKEEKKNK